MMPTSRLLPAVDVGLTPMLFWNETNVSSNGAALACPQCASPNLHLDAIHFAVPTEDHYTPTAAVSITPHTGAVIAGDEARHLHGGANRGPMLAIGYWCEHGCQGRIELREHKGHLFVSLHQECPEPPA
jgi:hypothetical protein